jgi:hypothetical protein
VTDGTEIARSGVVRLVYEHCSVERLVRGAVDTGP